MFASPCLHGVLVSSAVNLPSAINSSSISHRPGFLAVLCPRSLINESTSFCIPVLAWLGAGEYERQRAGQREVGLTRQHLRPRQRVYRPRRTSFRPDTPSTPRLSARLSAPPRSPWTIGPPSAVISFWRAAGFPLITQFLLLFNLMWGIRYVRIYHLWYSSFFIIFPTKQNHWTYPPNKNHPHIATVKTYSLWMVVKIKPKDNKNKNKTIANIIPVGNDIITIPYIIILFSSLIS